MQPPAADIASVGEQLDKDAAQLETDAAKLAELRDDLAKKTCELAQQLAAKEAELKVKVKTGLTVHVPGVGAWLDSIVEALCLANCIVEAQYLVSPHFPYCPVGTGGAFPEETQPECGYWVGKTCATPLRGPLDIGIKIPGEPVFTRSRLEVAGWIPARNE